MSRTLYLLWPENGAAETWAVMASAERVDAAEPVVQSRLPNADRIVLVVPGDAVRALRVPIPARTDAEARRAAPFAIEDFVGESVEKLHVALGPRAADGEREVRVAARRRMDEWSSWLRAAGADRAEIVAEYDLLGAPSVLVQTGDDLVASLPHGRMRIGLDLPDDLIAPILRDQGFEGEGRVFGHGLARRLGVEAAGPGADDAADWLTLAARLVSEASSNAVDLRQGEYASRRKFDASPIKAWRVAIGLAAGLALATFVAGTLEIGALKRGIADMRAEMSRAVSARYPEADASNPVAAVQAALKESRQSSAEFEMLSAAVYGALSTESDGTLTSLRYDVRDGSVVAGVNLSAFGDAERVAENLRRLGLSVTVGELRNARGRVAGEIRVGVAP